MKRLLFCGVGCQVQGVVFLLCSRDFFTFTSSLLWLNYHCNAEWFLKNAALRSVEQHLNLEKLYVLGTNCGTWKQYCVKFGSIRFYVVRQSKQYIYIYKYFQTVDNGTREGLDKFLKAASTEPETVLHYEFMQDYKVCVAIAHTISYWYLGFFLPKLFNNSIMAYMT